MTTQILSNDDALLRNLITDYVVLADRRKFREYADLFADSGRVIMQGVVEAQGRETIFDWISAYPLPIGRHLTCNLRIEVDGDAAAGQCTLMFVSAELKIVFVGDYGMDFVRTDGGWKIAEWRLT